MDSWKIPRPPLYKRFDALLKFVFSGLSKLTQPGKQNRRRAYLPIILWCFSSSIALAIDPTEQLSELNHSQWTAKDGCPPYIDDIVQQSNGILWLASDVGLFQFDGIRFQRLTLADGSQPVSGAVKAVAAISDDLWIGMRLGGAFLLHQGRLTHYGVAEGLPKRSIMGFAARLDGTVWAQTSGGLYFLHEGKWSRASSDWGYPATTGEAIHMDKNGTLWTLGAQGMYYLPKDGHLFTKVPSPGGHGWISAGVGDGGYFSDDLGIRRLSGMDKPITGKDLGGDTSDTGAGGFDSDGGLWTAILTKGVSHLVRVPNAAKELATHGRLQRGDAQILKPTQSLSGEPFTFYEDKEHNFWLGTDGGLDQFRSNKLHSAIESFYLEEPAMTVDSQGDVWLGMPHRSVHFRSLPNLPTVSDYVAPGESVVSLLVERDGGLTIGQEGGGLGRIKDKRYVPIAVPDRHQSYAVHGLARDATGTLWMASTGNGLYRQDGSRWKLNGGFQRIAKRCSYFTNQR